MPLQEWLKSSSDYPRKLVESAIAGAHSGEEIFLHGQPLAPFLNESARNALRPALLGAFLGALSACSGSRPKSIKAFAYGFLGCAIGFGAGFTWQSRRLGVSVAHSAWKRIGVTRDEHWLAKNPIDYA